MQVCAIILRSLTDEVVVEFAKKSLKIENFGHLFPLNSKCHDMDTRKSDYYKVSKSYSKRYLKSAIPSMQRLLNRDKENKKKV